MERRVIFEKVRQAIVEASPDLEPDDITETASFHTLGLDSLKVIELGVRVEQIFGERVALDDWMDEESDKGLDGFTMSSFLDFIERNGAP